MTNKKKILTEEFIFVAEKDFKFVSVSSRFCLIRFLRTIFFLSNDKRIIFM